MVSVFDKFTCSGDIVCDIFDNEDNIITGNYIVWVNTNKAIWQGKFIKIPFSDMPHDYSDHELHPEDPWI